MLMAQFHTHIAHITEDMHTGFLKRSILQERDVLLSIAGTLGKTGIVHKTDLPLNTNQAIAFVRLLSQNISEIFIKHAIDCPALQEWLLGQTKVTSIPNLTLEIVSNCPIPLPPLPEQRRIVACIESLFQKLEEAQEKLQAVVDGFESRKAAILHKAFTGELTAKWRETHGVGMESWASNVLGAYLGPQETKKPTSGCFRYIDIDSIDNQRQVVREPKTIAAKDAPSRASRGLQPNDVVFSMVRPYLKNIAYIDESLADCIASTGFYVCRCKRGLLPAYLYSFLQWDVSINYFMQYMKGDNSPSIRKNDLLGMPVHIPGVCEQIQIADALDILLRKERQAKSIAEAALGQVGLMKKAILARAFRGELGTNDPAEENAAGLWGGDVRKHSKRGSA